MKTSTLLLGLLLVGVATSAFGAGESSDAQSVFERRILPIFKSPNPSSCTECHLAGVDLKNYILPSHEKTFLSLRDQGLVDLASPAESKILRLIARGGGTNQGASLVSAKVRAAELAAFTEWITASARDPKLRAAAKLSAAEVAKPARPLEVIRHARTDRLRPPSRKTSGRNASGAAAVTARRAKKTASSSRSTASRSLG